MTPDEPELYNYIQFSERFPTPLNSDDMWSKLLLRFRKRGVLIENKHYKIKYYGHLRYMYSIPAVVRAICLEARKPDRPIPTCVHLSETYYNEFCTILTELAEQRASRKA